MRKWLKVWGSYWGAMYRTGGWTPWGLQRFSSAVLFSRCCCRGILLLYCGEQMRARTRGRDREIEREGGDSSGQMSMRVFVRASAFVCSSTLLWTRCCYCYAHVLVIWRSPQLLFNPPLFPSSPPLLDRVLQVVRMNNEEKFSHKFSLRTGRLKWGNYWMLKLSS